MKNLLIVSAFGLAAFLSQSRTAQALSFPAVAGKPFFSSQASCITPDFTNATAAGARNSCSFNVTYDLPMAVNQGTHSVFVGGDNGMSCTLFSNFQIGLVSSQQSGTITTGVMTLTATVPNSGYLNLRCFIPPNHELFGVNYGQ